MISKKFIKSSFLYTVAGTLPMASAVILLPFYIHYLPTEGLGALSIYMAFSGLIQIIVTFSFDTSLYLHFHEYKNDFKKLSIFTSSAFVLILMISTVLGLLLVFFGGIVFDSIFVGKNISFYPYGLVSVVTAIFQSVFKVQSSLLQSREKPGLYFWSNLISFSLIALFTIIGFYQSPNTLVGPLGGRMLAAILVGCWTLFRIFSEFGFHFNYKILKESFSYNISSFIYQLQLWSVNYLDRFLMLFYLPLDQVGIYDFAMKCMILIDFIMGGIYNSFYPKIIGEVVSQSKKQSTIQINRYYHGLTAVIMLLVCCSTLFFSLLMDTGLLRSGYEKSAQYLPLIGIVYLIRSMRYYFVFPYGALKYSKPLPFIYMAVSILKILVMVAIIPIFGVYAAIYSSIAATILEVLLLRFAIMKKFEFKFNPFKIIIAPLLVSALLVLSYFLTGINPYLIQSSILILCISVLWLIYKAELKLVNPLKWIR